MEEKLPPQKQADRLHRVDAMVWVLIDMARNPRQDFSLRLLSEHFLIIGVIE